MIPNLLVEDALESVDHRVRPDTPLSEVVDLMVRRGIAAVPVVGDGSEVLGIVTSGDALGQLMHEPSVAGVEPEELLTARDVMTRAVMCVSEGQPLIEAVHMMLHRDVDQIPVAREGRLVGIVTRANVLRALHLRKEATLLGGRPS
ncbi:MAG: CBS domain-containing protein [Gemmatimonadales bacterium]